VFFAFFLWKEERERKPETASLPQMSKNPGVYQYFLTNLDIDTDKASNGISFR
jgi:hypothetical protein